MKKCTMAITVLFCHAILLSTQAQKKAFPYKANYTSSFVMGKTQHALMVLNVWKDWDDNELERHDYFADTIKMIFSDSTVITGKAAALEAAKKYRGAMKSAKSVVHAWIPLYSTDRKEYTVSIWGTETDTFSDGRVDVRDLHEVWWFNSAGKISAMRQWVARFGE